MYNELLQDSYLTRNVSHLSGIITLGNLKLNINWLSYFSSVFLDFIFVLAVVYFSCFCSLYLCAACLWHNKEQKITRNAYESYMRTFTDRVNLPSCERASWRLTDDFTIHTPPHGTADDCRRGLTTATLCGLVASQSRCTPGVMDSRRRRNK